MKVVYISGPYSATNEYEVKINIFRAERWAKEVWATKKAAAICPHMNTAHWGTLLTHQDFIAGDLSILARCDAILMIPDWEQSKGATMEHDFAKARDIPIFYSLGGLQHWMAMEVAA